MAACKVSNCCRGAPRRRRARARWRARWRSWTSKVRPKPIPPNTKSTIGLWPRSTTNPPPFRPLHRRRTRPPRILPPPVAQDSPTAMGKRKHQWFMCEMTWKDLCVNPNNIISIVVPCDWHIFIASGLLCPRLSDNEMGRTLSSKLCCVDSSCVIQTSNQRYKSRHRFCFPRMYTWICDKSGGVSRSFVKRFAELWIWTRSMTLKCSLCLPL